MCVDLAEKKFVVDKLGKTYEQILISTVMFRFGSLKQRTHLFGICLDFLNL